jgi:hypothetical protein
MHKEAFLGPGEDKDWDSTKEEEAVEGDPIIIR